MVADLFPTRVRFSGVALSYNVGVALLSDTAPLLATAAIAATGIPAAPAEEDAEYPSMAVVLRTL